MVHPDKVREEAKKRENENSRFRSYLKGHADETKHKPCDFLQEDGNCKQSECKPEACKKYPYTD